MSVSPLFAFDDSFVRQLPGLYEPWQAADAPDPHLLLLNDALAAELGLDPAALRSDDGVRTLIGNVVTPGSTPVAQAYSGHQFGGFSPRLGDGRALLLGELVGAGGHLRDLHLKGSGRTPFSRGGDGKAAVAPMLREYVISEAMHALGIPTTRALAVVATGERIARDTMTPGAVLVRVAASHLRVGTFQYAAAQPDSALLPRLADYAIARHYPPAASADNPYLALFEAVVDAQASLIARWMLVGFIHGVMNTDNMTISGETIDYGPCAFMDLYDPTTVFSSIDHGGRYAFGNQPRIAQWNLAHFAETLLPLLADDADAGVAAATEVLQSFSGKFHDRWTTGMLAKLGIIDRGEGDDQLIDDLLTTMHAQRVDFTQFFRSLSAFVGDESVPVGSGAGAAARSAEAGAGAGAGTGAGGRASALGGAGDSPSGSVGTLTGPGRTIGAAFGDWLSRWLARVVAQGRSLHEIISGMDAVNPIYIPRNHIVEAALTSGANGDLAPVVRLLEVLADPYTERQGLEDYATAPEGGSDGYRTFCGT